MDSFANMGKVRKNCFAYEFKSILALLWSVQTVMLLSLREGNGDDGTKILFLNLFLFSIMHIHDYTKFSENNFSYFVFSASLYFLFQY